MQSLARLPEPVRGVLTVVAGVAMYAVVRVGIDATPDRHHLRFVLSTGVVVLLLVWFWWARRRMNRKLGPDQARALRTAVKTGELPPGADARLLRPYLENSRRALRMSRYYEYFYVASWAVGIVVLAVLFALHPPSAGTALFAVVPIGIFAGLGWWMLRMSRRRAERVESALRQTDRGPDPDTST